MFKKLIIIFSSIFMALIAFEIFLEYSPFEYGTSPVEYDSKIGMWHKKNHTGYAIRSCYKTKYIFDSKGLPKSIYKYDNNKKDVILLGDSFIEAIMVKNRFIIHNALAKEFNNKYNFLNYGLSRTGPTQQFAILKDKVDLNNTRYVIQFIQLEGDLMDVDSKNFNALERPEVSVVFDSLDKYRVIPPRSKTFIDNIQDKLGDYQIYFFIKKLLYYVKDQVSHKKRKVTEDKSDVKPKIDLSKNWLYIKGAIHQINKYIKSINKNIEYKLIVRSNNEENKMILKKFLKDEKIKYIFLNDTAKSMGIKLTTFKCDGHWTDQTHLNIAKIIKDTNLIK